MAYDQRDNSGAIFKNDKREKDSHPNGRGKAMIGGVMYYVDAWTKDGAQGKYQSLSFKAVEQAHTKAAVLAPKPVKSAHASGAFDDGIPFNKLEWRI